MRRALPTGWVSFFDRPCHPRDRRLLRQQAEWYAARLAEVVPLERRSRVLEFGCGYGFVARALAPHVREVVLWDPAPAQVQLARANIADHPNTRFLDLPAIPAAEAGRFDLIIVNSVVQYMEPADLAAWLPRWRDLLAPRSCLVLSDLMPPELPSWRDTIALLRFCLRQRCFWAALGKLLRDAPRYWRARRRHRVYRLDGAALREIAAQHGLATRILTRNLTHFPHRWTAVLTVARR